MIALMLISAALNFLIDRALYLFGILLLSDLFG